MEAFSEFENRLSAPEPKRARMGVYAANRLSARLPGLIFREQRGGDTGLNAHLEVVEEYPRMGKVVGLQIRSAADVERAARGYVCRGEMAHVAYWLQHSLPVIVMVHEEERDRLAWAPVFPDNLEINGQRWELLVPDEQTYGPEAVDRIVDLPCYSPYLARLALDRPWMQLIEAGRGIFLELDEWLNQPTDRGSLRLSVAPSGDGLGEDEGALYDWPFQTNPDLPHVFRLPSLFPWASISVDQEFYREKNGEATEPGALVPWIVEAGAIARFRLRLALNELGRAFLTADQFLRRGEFPTPPSQAAGFGAEYERGLKFRLYREKG